MIHDLFYQKHNSSTEGSYSNSSETEEYDEELFEELDVDGLTVIGDLDTEQENILMLRFDIDGVVNKVRKIVKLFKRSPLRNEVLQTYVREKHPNGLQLILDCKTRWSSLLNMLERILKISVPVQKSLLDLNIDIKLTDEEFTQVSFVVQALQPIKIAVEALCRRDANFISAEATILFYLMKSRIIFHQVQNIFIKLLKQ